MFSLSFRRLSRGLGIVPQLAFSFAAIPLLYSSNLCGQAVSAPATRPAEAGSDLIALDFPADGVELSLLADVVTQRLHIPILYDETIRTKKVIIRVPVKVPESALMGILQSALRMKQMALVDAEQPGWKQIVAAPSLAAVAKPAGAGGITGAEGAIAQVFILNHADPTRIAEIVRPFLTQPNGYLQADAAKHLLIVSDYSSVVKRIEEMVHLLDADTPPAEVRFVPMKEAEASQVVTVLKELLSSRETSAGVNPQTSNIFLTADDRANQIVMVAPPQRVKEVMELIDGIDVAAGLHTRVYRLKIVSPERVDRLVRGLLGANLVKRGYQSVIDADSQSLAVSATPQVFERIDELLKELDVPAAQTENPIQFYKLKNTKASDVLSTIGDLLGQEKQDNGQQGAGDETGEGAGGGAPGGRGSAPSSSAAGGSSVGGASSGPFSSGPSGGAFGQTGGGASGGFGSGAGGAGGMAQGSSGAASSGSDVQYTAPVLSGMNGQQHQGPGTLSVKSRNATVAADVNSNSIIVIAPPPVQRQYADLIKRLDERRPQVQIECTIVSLDTSDGFSFGVDIGKLGGFGTSQLLTLSSFGISTANAMTGQLTPAANPGGTFALLSPRIANIVVNALANNSRSRFLSSPQLLVNDNGKGKLESVAQQPFAVILDASTTQSLTSLGGLAQAGTSITVEPHISDADYLQLTYSIELSNFTGAASNGLPPPSDKNAVDSSVTIPDGYTIVVGGLTTHTLSDTVNTIPILGDIPILKYLFGQRSHTLDDTTLFVFIKPVILRDDKFEDLKYLSGVARHDADIPNDFPQGQPIPMR